MLTFWELLAVIAGSATVVVTLWSAMVTVVVPRSERPLITRGHFRLIFGAANAVATDVGPEVARIKQATDLPVCVGFGIKTAENAADIAGVADGAVVGSAIVDRVGKGENMADVLAFVG